MCVSRPFRYVPPPRGQWTFLRPRLQRTVASRWDLRLLTIEAGAGVGKTTLLTHAVEENLLDPQGRDVWLSLEAGDSSPSTLAASLLHALGRPKPDGRPTIATVCEAIWDDAPEQICLVLDDAHHLDAAPSGAEALAELLAQLPSNGHLLVAGRTLPVIPRARLLLQQQAMAVVEADLRFTPEEQASFARLRGVPATLLDGTAGWPALAELRASFGADTDQAFLWEEVLDPLSPSDRQAFMLIAAIGGGDAEIVAAAAGHVPDTAHLATLPLSAGDGHGGLRPHALWGEMVRPRLDRMELEDCRRRVATALRDRGDYGSAFELLAGAHDWDAALATLFDACNDQNHPPWPDVVTRWRTMIDPSLAARAEVAYLDAYVERSADPWSDVAWASFHRAVDTFHAAGDVRRAAVGEVRMLWSAWLRGDRDAVELIDRRMYPALTGRAGSGLTANLAILADLDGESDRLRELSERLVGARLEPRLSHFAGIHRMQADMIDGCASATTADHAATAATAGRLIEPAAASGWAILAPAVVSWARGRLADAMTFDVSEIGPRFSIADQAPAFAFAAVRAAHLGHAEEAEAHADALRRLVPDEHGRDLLIGFRAVTDATLLVVAGDEAGAAEALRSQLACRSLAPSGAGKAVFWFPALPYLLDTTCRTALDARGHGVTRRRVVDACCALDVWRRGATLADGADLSLLDDPAALLTALPLPLAVELATRAHERRDPRGRSAIEGLSSLAPAGVRDALVRLSRVAAGTVRKAAASVSAGLAIPPPHDVRIEVFGPTRMLRGGVPVKSPDLGRERVRQLLLATVAHREIRRSRLGTLLWPDFDEAGVSANLRMTLSYLQALLEPDRLKGAAPWFLRQDSGVLRLGGTQLHIDAWEAEAALDDADRARADATPSIELQRLLHAVQLWRGDYLEDVAGEEWAAPLRNQVTGRLVRAAVRAGELLIGAGRAEEAIEVAERALRAEPWSEAAYRVAIRARLARRDRAGALRSLAACKRMCADLGVEPEGSTYELERTLARTSD